MIYYNGQVINPEKFRIPSYNISPFSTGQLSLLNNILHFENKNDDFEAVNRKFGHHEFTLSGKNAIAIAMSFYNLNCNDEVCIITTTGNEYISSCVTNEIEKCCRWKREISEHTKLIFVIHEFGIVYPNMEDLIELNIPIVEDLSMSLFSTNEIGRIGKYGDFTTYSLPKFFPVQYGGVLSYNNNKFLKNRIINNSKPFQIDLKKITSFFLSQEKEIIQKRKENYKYFEKLFNDLGIKSRITFTNKETPSVFMFTSEDLNLSGLKIFMQKNGVECSKFYGENSFFLPVHQNLSQFDMNYIVNLIKYFIYENK